MSNALHFNSEIEKDLITSILCNQELAIKSFTVLKPDDFCDTMSKLSFEACLKIFKKNLPVETVLVIAELEIMQVPKAREYIELISKRPKTSSAGLINNVLEMSQRRSIYAYLEDIKKVLTTETDFEEVLNVLRTPPTFDNGLDKVYTIDELLDNATTRLIQKMKSENIIQGIPTGFKELDIMTGGLMKKEMTIIGARPSIGKSVLSLDIARYSSKKGFNVAYFSLEMGKEQLIDRGISSELLIESDKLKYPKLFKESDYEKLDKSSMADNLKTFFVIDKSNMQIADIRAKCLEIKLLYDELDMIVIDYLQYMNGKGLNKREIVENNSKSLKQLAKDLNIHVIVISSLNRSSEMTASKIPSMSDLRESGQIEYDADNIILMHRDRLGEDKTTTQLLVEKQRNGRIGIIKIKFLEKFTTFRDF